MKKLLASVALASAALSLTACGAKSDPVAAHAKDSIKQAIIDDAKSDSSNPVNNEQTAGCTANALVDKLGVSKLQGYGLIDKDGNAVKDKLKDANASKDDATSVVDAMITCVGTDKLSQSINESITKEEPNMPQAVKDCMAKALDKDTIRNLMIAELEGKDSADAKAATTAMMTKLMPCAMGSMGQ
jgi:hypothetical protein